METLKDLNPRNPLGIIALFVSFCYLLSSIVISINIGNFADFERSALVLFIIFFPLIIFCAFFILVVAFHNHLYAPKDFRSDMAFLGNIAGAREIEEKKENEINELETTKTNIFIPNSNQSEKKSKYDDYEYKALRYIERQYSMFLKRDIKIGSFIFDAIGITSEGNNYLIEIKMTVHKTILLRTAKNMITSIQEDNKYKNFIPLLIVVTKNNSELNNYIPELKYNYPSLRIESIDISYINNEI